MKFLVFTNINTFYLKYSFFISLNEKEENHF